MPALSSSSRKRSSVGGAPSTGRVSSSRKAATNTYAVKLGRAAAESGTSGISGANWDVYERTLDKLMEDGKLSRKDKRVLNKLAKELRKAGDATAQASTDAQAYAAGIPPAEHEDRGVAIAQAIAGVAGTAGAAIATAYGQPQLGAALQAAGSALGVPISSAQVATPEGQQQAAVAVGQAAAMADYQPWYQTSTGGISGAGILAGLAGLALAALGYGALSGGRRNAD